MSNYFVHRSDIRVVFGILFLLILLVINAYMYVAFNASATIFISLLIPALNLLNDFAPDIYAFITTQLGNPERVKFVADTTVHFAEFLRDYFSLQIDLPRLKESSLPLATQLETLIRSAPPLALGASQQSHSRRQSLMVMLFFIKYADTLRIDEHEPVLAYVKARFRGLTDAGKRDFLCAYFQLVIHDRKFLDASAYFAAVNDRETESARLNFYDRYLKDDYIGEVTSLLRLRDAQIDSFKSSLEAVTKSGTLNLSYLKRFIDERKRYRRLFIVTSDKKLPKAIQGYIMQNPYFILNWSSIANLPKVGLSRRFDIFFFSPLAPVVNAQALLNEFIKIDSEVITHPLKIYTVDPAEGAFASLEPDSEFSQAIRYFENNSFDTTIFGDLSFEQLMAVLEQSKISLKDLIAQIPVAEFSNLVSDAEKPFVNRFLEGFTTISGKYSVFHITGKRKHILSRLSGLRQIPKNLDTKDLGRIISGKVTIGKFRARMRDIIAEVCGNIDALDSTLV